MKGRTRAGFTKLLFVAAPLLAAAVALFYAQPALSYLPTFASANSPTRWDFTSFPVQWNLNPNTSGTKVGGSRPVADVIQASFNSWTGAPNAAVLVARGANTSVSSESSSPSNINLICFVCTDADFASDQSTLAVTLFSYATRSGQSDGHGGTTRFPGQMIKADILFNPADPFSTDPTSDPSTNDLQTVATHEIGHFLGLDHSAVISAVMYPFSPAIRETLSWDDVAGISTLYPKATKDVATGVITGTVRFASSGGGVFGAHVFADSVTSAPGYGGSVRRGPIGTLTLPNGTYTINGVPQDSYTITAEPLDGPVSNGQVSDYPKALGQPSVQTNFTTRQH
jgi:hypothetical protein